jgi:isopentenyldiphosphate isomerase
VWLTRLSFCSVDYILFLTADVTVNPNPNEIRDYKYVDKPELQAMFEDQGMKAELLYMRVFWRE